MKRPLIGITLDAEPAGGWSRFPWYALRQNYAASLAMAGALPVALPHHADLAADYVATLDGLLITGGAFDVDPALWGDEPPHPKTTTKPERTAFELAATRAALARDLPVLGICGGAQLLAVAWGGALHQHIPDAIPGALAHEQPNPRDQPGHAVQVHAGTRLAEISGRDVLAVNSAHHQGIATPGSARISATAPDGVIEAIEHPGHRFAMGVQWHPEFAVDPADALILAAFVAACR